MDVVYVSYYPLTIELFIIKERDHERKYAFNYANFWTHIRKRPNMQNISN
jgi:hypothetical protein